MSWPPASIAANKAPGPPSSATEHPDHHNEMATAINTVVARVDGAPTFISFNGTWPDATVSASVVVVWIQPNIDGSSPPSGGRPGREPGDIVLIAQG
jgi:hypothetical protein